MEKACMETCTLKLWWRGDVELTLLIYHKTESQTYDTSKLSNATRKQNIWISKQQQPQITTKLKRRQKSNWKKKETK